MSNIVIIPAYNEEKNIKEIVLRTKRAGYLPLVVDDSSTDKTSEIAKKHGAIVLRHEINMGKGIGLNTAFNYILKNLPKVKYIAILDADLQYLPEDLPKLFSPLEKNEADYVTGYRNWKTVPLRHRIGNFVWRTTFNIIFNTRFKDTNCGFIAMNRKAMKVLLNSTQGGYIIENMMMIDAMRNNLRIKQVPVRVFYYDVRDIPTGIRYVLGNLIYIIQTGLRLKYGIEIRLYRQLERLKWIFTKATD